jgi:hypothetical protein
MTNPIIYTLRPGAGDDVPDAPWDLADAAANSRAFQLHVEAGVDQERVRSFLDALAMLLSPVDEQGDVDLSNPYVTGGGE